MKVAIILAVLWLFVPAASYMDTLLAFNPQTRPAVIIGIPIQPTFADIFWSFMIQNSWEIFLMSVALVGGAAIYRKELKGLERPASTRRGKSYRPAP